MFWREDADGDGALDPDELVVLFGMPEPEAPLLQDGGFTPAFRARYAELARSELPRDLPEGELERRRLVREELAQGRPTLIETRLSDLSAGERKMVDHVVAAAALVEAIHAQQKGSAGLIERVKDPESRMMFYRNQGPWCVAPTTESQDACSAIAGGAEQVYGLYPADLQDQDGFCAELEALSGDLLDPFTVVVREGGELKAIPYHVAYASEMTQVARELEAAAAALEGLGELAYQKYLRAAAKAFRDGSWRDADEAWAAMSVHNSKWYLRIGPDEVYFEPCNRKAGFHVSFARINRDSLEWQRKLDPLKGEMERALAARAGPPYEARQVAFHLPDFIDIVLNAGDSRNPQGATIGQSLPNWGPVANEGRGRTVAMTNLYTDPDSLEALRSQAASLLCEDTMAYFVDDPGPQILSTVLHEAAHNLGPAHEYTVSGKTDDEIFGGPLASTLEELKAQTAALYLLDWLVEQEAIEPELARKAHVRDVVWAFGHISRGMYDAEGKPKPYSQLAATQLGHLVDAGVAVWRPESKAQNGEDAGCLSLDLDAFPAAVRDLMTEVAGIKARGDLDRAKQLIAAHVEAQGKKVELASTIRARWLRAPKASFVYALVP